VAENVEIASHTIPGTNKTITIVLRPAEPRWGQLKDLYLVTRQGGRNFNYLQCGRNTEAEARTEANSLWTDAVQRTRAGEIEAQTRAARR
jgi:hypothetical protein